MSGKEPHPASPHAGEEHYVPLPAGGLQGGLISRSLTFRQMLTNGVIVQYHNE